MHLAPALPPGVTALAQSIPTTATELPTEMATAPRTEAPPRTAAVPAPQPGLPAPRPRPTTASATAPRRLPTAAPAAAATLGAPRLPLTASQRPPPALAVPIAGATRLAQVAALTRTTRPLLAPGWVRRRPLLSTPRLRALTRRLPRPLSTLRRRVPGRVVGVLMLRLLRPWVRPRLLPAADTTVRRRRPRMVVPRRRRPRQGGFSTLMMIDWAEGFRDSLVLRVNGSGRLARKGWRHQRVIFSG